MQSSFLSSKVGGEIISFWSYFKVIISCNLMRLSFEGLTQSRAETAANLMMWMHYKAAKVVKLNVLHDKGTEYKSPICCPHVICVLDPCSAAAPSNTHTTPFLLRMIIALCPSVCWLTLPKGVMEGIAAPDLAVCCQTYSTSSIHFHFQ